VTLALAMALTLAGADAGASELSLQYLGPRPPAPARRVVTLAPSLTELVVALGAGGALVGVSRYDELPEVKEVPRVGGFVDPSVEAVLAQRPDLVLVQPGPGNRRPVEKMAELGVPVLVLPLHDLDEVGRAMREVGRALGRPEKGEELARELERTRQEIRARAKRLPPRRVLVVYGFAPFVVAGPGSFADELLRDAGAVNAADRARTPYPVYSVESAVRSRPDVVIDAVRGYEGGGERLRALPGLREARWLTLSSEDLLHPGPHIARGLEALFELIHGGADAGR